MQLVTDREEFCTETGQNVVITAYADAEGGYGCAIHTDTVEYECKMQKSCSVYKKGGCVLTKSF